MQATRYFKMLHSIPFFKELLLAWSVHNQAKVTSSCSTSSFCEYRKFWKLGSFRIIVNHIVYYGFASVLSAILFYIVCIFCSHNKTDHILMRIVLCVVLYIVGVLSVLPVLNTCAGSSQLIHLKQCQCCRYASA